MKFQLFFYATFLACPVLLLGGFTKGTMIRVPTGYCEVEHLKVDDWVCAIKPDGNATVAQIDQIVSYVWHKYMIIEIDGVSIVAVTGQKFYQPLTHKWIKAKHVEQGTALLSGVGQVRYVTSVCKVHESIEVFDIKMKDVHTFCVSELDIVVHNYGMLAIGLSIAWGLSKIAFEKLLRDICIAGLALLGKHAGCEGKSEGQNWKIESVRRTFLFGEKSVDIFEEQERQDNGPARFLQSLSSDEFLNLCRHVLR
ncbi:MAG: Hint domain-containing protein [Candidatus Babeliales bacterium]|jgi:hypothetical protein